VLLHCVGVLEGGGLVGSELRACGALRGDVWRGYEVV
jgi:hypothetical protein